jgi:hypothetical protein
LDKTGKSAEAKQDQHDGNGKLHCKAEPDGDRDFENYDRGTHGQHCKRMAQSPYNPNAARCGKAAFATHNGRDCNYMVGISRVPHSH